MNTEKMDERDSFGFFRVNVSLSEQRIDVAYSCSYIWKWLSKPEKIQLTPRKSIESSVLSFFFYCGSPEKKTPREPNTRKSINPKKEDKGRKKDLFTYLGTGHKRVATYTYKKAIGPFTMSETN